MPDAIHTMKYIINPHIIDVCEYLSNIHAVTSAYERGLISEEVVECGTKRSQSYNLMYMSVWIVHQTSVY